MELQEAFDNLKKESKWCFLHHSSVTTRILKQAKYINVAKQ